MIEWERWREKSHRETHERRRRNSLVVRKRSDGWQKR